MAGTRRWRSKPFLGVGLDSSNPVAQSAANAFPFNETSGTALNAVGKYSSRYSLGTANTWVPTPLGVAVRFDGTSSSICSPSSGGTFLGAWNYTQPWTVAFWYLTPSSFSASMAFVSNLSGGNLTGYELGILNTGVPRVLVININLGYEIRVQASSALAVNTLYHIVWTWTGSGVGSGFTYYLNGAQSGMSITSDSLNGMSTASGAAFLIGGRIGNLVPLSGTLAGLEIFDTALPPGEVASLCNRPWQIYRPRYRRTVVSVGGITYTDTVSAGIKGGLSSSGGLIARPLPGVGVKLGETSSGLVVTSKPTTSVGVKSGATSTVVYYARPSASVGVKAGVFGLSSGPVVYSLTVSAGIKSGISSTGLKSTSRPTTSAGIKSGISSTVVSYARPTASVGVKAGWTSVVVATYTPTLRKAVTARLKSLSEVVSLVGSRVYPKALPQSWTPSKGSALVYDVSSEERESDLDGLAKVAIADVEVRAVSTSYAESEEIVLLLISAFPTNGGVIDGLSVDWIQLDGEREFFDYLSDGSEVIAHGVSQSFKVSYQTGV